jgi:hypothetical protein
MGHSRIPDGCAGWSRTPRDGILLAAWVLLAGCATTSSNEPLPKKSARTTGYEVREARDDEPERSGIAVQAEHGTLRQDEAEDAIRSRWTTLVRCYARAGEAQRYAGGSVTLRFFVGLDGRATDVHVLESRVGNFDVERCLVHEGRTVAFPQPKGGPATFEYSLEFRSTGEVSVVDLPAEDVTGELPGFLPRLAAECDQRLGADEVMATLYIEGRGAVRSVGLAADAALDADAALCVAGALRRWTVPVPVRSGAVGRVTLALRQQDLLSTPPPARTSTVRGATRLTQAPRARGNRRR